MRVVEGRLEHGKVTDMSESTEPIRLRTCPRCGTRGKIVEEVTLRSLVKREQQHRISEGTTYRFCNAQGCDVVYFAEDGSHVFTRDDLTVRVGVKETEPPRPVCYCFHHTVEDIFDEIRRTGKSTIPDDIRTRINSEGCHCERTNPQGSCCLGVVQAFVQEGLTRFGAGESGSKNG